MAIFRKVHTSFWSDTFIQDLSIEQRYFYLYLLTNEQTKQCGVYEISKKQISFDTGYSIDRVSILLNFFISKGKIRYNDTTKELAMGKWLKYNNSTSPKIKSCIDKEFEQVKDRVLIEYVCSMDTSSQEEQEQEQEEEEEEEKNKRRNSEIILIKEILDESYFNLVINWLDYKQERQENYKPIGLKTFLNSIKKNYSTPKELETALEKCMSNNYSGLFKDKTTPNQPQQTQPQFKGIAHLEQ